MVILAGVAIAVAVGDGGVINKAQTATEAQKYKIAREQVEAQCVYITKGENVGKVDLGTTLENIKDLNLKEIEYSDQKTRIEGNSLIVTLKNGEIITIGGENKNNSSNVKYYKISKEYIEEFMGQLVDVLLAIDYENGIVDLYYQDAEGKWQMSGTDNLQKLSSDMVIKVNGNDVTLDSNTVKMFSNGIDYLFVLPSKIYFPNFEEEDMFFEMSPTSEAPDSSELEGTKGNLLELINNRTISVGATITGYEPNGYRGSWIVYDIDGDNVKIVPISTYWNETYTYNPEITTNEEEVNGKNLTEVENICNKYLDSDFASSVALPISIEDAFATYYINGGGINNFGTIYMKKDGELRAANASSKSGSRKKRRTIRFW